MAAIVCKVELTSLQKEVLEYALYNHIYDLRRDRAALPKATQVRVDSYFRKKWQHIRCSRNLLKKLR